MNTIEIEKKDNNSSFIQDDNEQTLADFNPDEFNINFFENTDTSKSSSFPEQPIDNIIPIILNKKEEINAREASTSTDSSDPSSPTPCTAPIHQNILLTIDLNVLITQLKTHQGSISFQYILLNMSPQEINSLIYRLVPCLIEIMSSHYGNYFIQKLFYKLNLEQRLLVFDTIQNNFIQICANKSGTYSIQALIDVIKTPKEETIIKYLLCKNLLLLFCNQHAHHVIQKIIIDFPETKRDYLNKFVIENIAKICLNEYGTLCIIKFIIMNTNLFIRMELMRAINQNFIPLILNRFGCSVILFTIEKFGIGFTHFIFNEVQKNIIFFAQQNGLCISLFEKILNYMNKYDTFNFANMIWCLFKNEKALQIMAHYENGVRILYTLLKNATIDQKTYFQINGYHNLIKDKTASNLLMKNIA